MLERNIYSSEASPRDGLQRWLLQRSSYLGFGKSAKLRAVQCMLEAPGSHAGRVEHSDRALRFTVPQSLTL